MYIIIMLPSSHLQTKIQFLHVVFLSCKESYEKFKWIDIYTKHAGKSIPHSSNSERKDYFLTAQRNIHCYPASDTSRMNYRQSTVVTTYLCCCLMVRFNGKIMLIQPEETLVKFYYFKLQQPEFLAINKIIIPRHFFYPLRLNVEFPWKGTLANAIFPGNEILATLVMDYYLWHYK